MSVKVRELVYDGMKLRERLGLAEGEFAYRLHGWQVEALMNRHGVTIAELASRMQLTQKRVREVRAGGLAKSACYAALDWVEALTGDEMAGFSAADNARTWAWVHERLEGLTRPKGR